MTRMRIEVKPMGITDIYDAVAVEAGIPSDDDKIQYDCTKIWVSEDINRAVFRYYEQRCKDANLAFAMDWLCYGPKVNSELPDATVEIEDGFFKQGV